MSRSTITSVQGLVDGRLLEISATGDLDAVASRYAIAITPVMADLVELGQADDPIARQFVPDRRELDQTPGESADPIGDKAHEPVEGIVHRYPDRVLLKAVHVCPVYCRFCFRREMVGPSGDGMLAGAALDAAIDYIRNHPEIWEVILTGGDPLVLSSRRLADLVARLSGIAHVRVLRFHSRVPLVDPERIDKAMVDALTSADKTIIIALHANHPAEFSPSGADALKRLAASGIMLISQTVLLKGVNDDVGTLASLMRTFIAHRVKPYYLHHPDLAPGTGHFRLTIAAGRALVDGLRKAVSGICMPQYVLDIPGGFGKVNLQQSPVSEGVAEGYQIIDKAGQAHSYRDQ